MNLADLVLYTHMEVAQATVICRTMRGDWCIARSRDMCRRKIGQFSRFGLDTRGSVVRMTTAYGGSG